MLEKKIWIAKSY